MPDPDADLLGVAPDAPLSELKTAFRRAALAAHPDQNPHPDAARHFRRLADAYRSLEARALLREPPRPRREIGLVDRVGFLVGDLRSLVRRWPAERWNKRLDGLPAVVWAVSALEVLAEAWPGAPAPRVAPTVEGLTVALEAWSPPPLPGQWPAQARQRLADAAQAAENRLRALHRLEGRRA